MEMRMAVGAANWLLGKVLTKLSDGLVSAYMASSELESNFLNANAKQLPQRERRPRPARAAGGADQQGRRGRGRARRAPLLHHPGLYSAL